MELYLILLVIIALGIFMMRRPDVCWKLKHFLDTEGGEPSRFYRATVQVIGTAMVVISIVVAVVNLLSLVLK